MTTRLLLFCPYLPLDRAVEFGPWWLGPLDAYTGRWWSEDYEAKAKSFLGKFRDALALEMVAGPPQSDQRGPVGAICGAMLANLSEQWRTQATPRIFRSLSKVREWAQEGWRSGLIAAVLKTAAQDPTDRPPNPRRGSPPTLSVVSRLPE